MPAHQRLFLRIHRADAGGQDACGPEGLGGGLHEACGTAEKVVGVVGDKRREVLRRRTAMVGRGAQDEMAAFMAADARLDLVHAAEHGGRGRHADARRDEDERGVALGQAEASRRRGEVDEGAGREVAEDVRDHACREAVSCGNAADGDADRVLIGRRHRVLAGLDEVFSGDVDAH